MKYKLMLIMLLIIGAMSLCLASYTMAQEKPLKGFVYAWMLPDTSETSNGLGDNVSINKIVTGGIITGYINGDARYPIIKQGVMIEFSRELTPAELETLDLNFSSKGLQREGGTTIKERLLAIEADIATLQAVQSK